MNHDFITRLSRIEDPACRSAEIVAAYPGVPYLRPLLEWAFGPEDTAFHVAGLTAADALYVAGIRAHKRHQAGSHRSLTTLDVGLAEDVVGSAELIDQWPLSKLVCYLVALRTRPTRQCAAVVGMRNEGPTALEWIAHYKAIGVETIFVYTNDNLDNTADILEILAERGEIVLIRNTTSGAVYPQFKIYEHFVLLLPEARDYEWCCFFDSDELFAPSPHLGGHILNLLAAAEATTPGAGAIWYPWRWVVSANRFEREFRPLGRRFQHAWKHSLVKTIARMADVISLKPLHSPFLRTDSFPIDASFRRRRMDELFEEKDWPETSGMLHHYWCKSFQEFYLKKLRGDTLLLEDNAYKRDLDLFFRWNGSVEIADCPIPEQVLIAAAAIYDKLLSLPGMRAAIGVSEGRFRELVETDAQGRPLFDLYETLRQSVLAEPPPGA